MQQNAAARSGAGLKQLEFEMALELGLPGEPLVEAVRRAALVAGGKLVLTLPGADGAPRAVVSLGENGDEFLVEVRQGKAGPQVTSEDGIDEALRRFARTSIALTERLAADAGLLRPLAAL